MKSDMPQWAKAKVLAAAGAATFVLGWIMSFWIPPIRYIYTISFAFETLGLSTLLLCALYVLSDIYALRRGTWLLILFGQCSLVAWMATSFFGEALTAAAQRFVCGMPVLIGTNKYQLIFVAFAKVPILIWILWMWRRLRGAK